MKRMTFTFWSAVLLSSATLLNSIELPEMPPPVKEHQWLQQLVGSWESETEAFMEPGKPPIKGTGTETARMLGGFWLVSDISGEMPGMPAKMSAVFTLGYDPEKKKYVGTWVDSMTSYLWKYEGSVNAAGTTLTLESEGPCPTKPGQLSKFKDVLELKSKDHKVFTSSMLGDDGKWMTIMTVNSKRKK